MWYHRNRHYWNDDEKVKGRESLFRPAHVAHEGIRSGQVRQGEHACGVFGCMNDRHYTTHVELRYFCPHPCREPETRATRTSTTTVPRCSTPLDFWRCPLHQPSASPTTQRHFTAPHTTTHPHPPPPPPPTLPQPPPPPPPPSSPSPSRRPRCISTTTTTTNTHPPPHDCSELRA